MDTIASTLLHSPDKLFSLLVSLCRRQCPAFNEQCHGGGGEGGVTPSLIQGGWRR